MSESNMPHDVEVLLRQLNEEFVGWRDPAQRLVQVLEQNELVLYAQPIRAFRQPESFPIAEVLVRLREDEEVLLPPGGFLPLFEHFGVAPKLDRWVARETVARLAQSPRVPCLSMNISTQTLADPEYLPDLAAELARSKVPPASLIFEISENDALERAESAGRFATSARAIGCRLTMDGFGRRATSLGPLASMRPDFVKVDGMIVRTLHTSQTSRNKLNAIVRMAKAIGAGVIGGWVEKKETLEHLRALGADYAQGFVIQIPAPIRLIIGV